MNLLKHHFKSLQIIEIMQCVSRSNFVKLEVYFKDMIVETIATRPSYLVSSQQNTQLCSCVMYEMWYFSITVRLSTSSLTPIQPGLPLPLR